MADENELKELINQAITCDLPHIYGTVNLNRLREVLCLLVSARKPYEESLIATLSQSLDEETESFQGIVREVSNGEVACNSLHDVCDALASPPQEQDENEVEANVNSTCQSPSPKEPSCTVNSLQSILLEMEEVARKVNEINERVYKLETKSPPAICQCTCYCGMIEDDANSSKRNESHAGEKSYTQANVTESIFDAGCDQALNDMDDLQTTSEVVPPEVAPGNSIQKSPSVHSAGSTSLEGRDFKNNKPAATDAVASTDQDNGGVNAQHVDEESPLPASSHDTERNEVVVVTEDKAFTKFDELVATVGGLVERENIFFERLSNIEKLMSSYIDELYTDRQDKQCVAPTMVFDDNNIVQNLRQESGMPTVPEYFHQKNMDTERSLEAHIRSIIDELQKEMYFLKTAFNRLNIAAGGKIGTEIPTHIQCISCNCAAAMEIHEELIPSAVPFHVRRCMKPMLRRQLDLLEKEVKYSAVAPVSMQPYYQLLKKNKLLTPK